MNILVTGVNYKTADIDIREKLSFVRSDRIKLLERLAGLDNVIESVLVSTCNRTEVYVFLERMESGSKPIERMLCDFKELNLSKMCKYFYSYEGKKAVEHLFKVASGLDSMVLGEDQILGQIKEASETAIKLKTSSKILNTMFRFAITAAKRVKTLTSLSRNSLSIGSLAVKLLEQRYKGKLEDKTAMVIGAGKIGCITLKNLLSKGIGSAYVTNRSHGRALDLSLKIPVEKGRIKIIDYKGRYALMDECHIVISCTESPHYTITRDLLKENISTERERIFIDLAVPRDIDNEITHIKNLSYFNVDDLKQAAGENEILRKKEACKAEVILNEYMDEFTRWYDFRSVLPLVKDIQRLANEFVQEKTNRISSLESISEEDLEIVKESINSSLKDLMKRFVYNVKEYEDSNDLEIYFKCLRKALK